MTSRANQQLFYFLDFFVLFVCQYVYKLLDLSVLFNIHIHGLRFLSMAPLTTLHFIKAAGLLALSIVSLYFDQITSFKMPNIPCVVLSRHRFFSNLHLKSINRSLNNPRLTLSPYSLRGVFFKSFRAVSA